MTTATPHLNLPREPWKFSNLQRVVGALNVTTPPTDDIALPAASGPQYVFHNGHLQADRSAGLTPATGLTLHTEGGAFSRTLDALDTLPLTAGVTYTLTVTGQHEQPLHVLHVATGEPSVSRFRIELAAGASLTLIEHHLAASGAATWQNLGMEITLAEGASLTHSVQQTLPAGCVLSRRTFVSLADTATYRATTFQSGAAFSRIETHAELATETNFSHIGLSLARREQHHDCTLHVRHMGTANNTHIRQRNLIDDKAHAVFQGKFHVDQPAQKTDSYMHCHNLLLSDGARASHKPELEIYADDVKCSHGAATGGLNPGQLFYLQARGFPPAKATALLTEGFVKEFIEEFPESLHADMTAALTHWQAGSATESPTT